MKDYAQLTKVIFIASIPVIVIGLVMGVVLLWKIGLAMAITALPFWALFAYDVSQDKKADEKMEQWRKDYNAKRDTASKPE